MGYDPIDFIPQQPENRLAGGENRLLALARLMEAHGLGGGGMYGGAYPRNRLMAGMWPGAQPQYQNTMDFKRVTPVPPFMREHTFRDDIFKAPSAPGTETLNFDRMDLREQGAYPDFEEWLKARHLERAPRFR
jgi:hypothetical protein